MTACARRRGPWLWLLLGLTTACGGSSPSRPDPAPARNVPSPPAPSRVGSILLELVTVSPQGGTSLRRGTTQRFTARLRYDAGDSTATPLFLVAHVRQWNGPVLEDDPDDFHFPTPGRSGETDATIERIIIGSPGAVWITWTLAMQNPDLTTLAGASFTTTFTID